MPDFLIKKSNSQLPPDSQKAIRILCDDFELWCEKCVKIKTTDGIQPFILKPAQKRFVELYFDQWKRFGRVRLICLKARQMGYSTLIQALYMFALTQSSGKNCLVIGMVGKNVEGLFDMYKRTLENLPEVMCPVLTSNNAKRFRFSELDTSISIDSAKGENMGRGGTFSHVHASEFAFWDATKAGGNYTSLMQAVHRENTSFIIESTANGVSNLFATKWNEAVEGTSDLVPFFSPWFEEPTYRLKELPPRFERTYEEQDLADEYDLDDYQLAWRRWKISECTSLDEFKQEFPAFPDEAFIGTGSPVFSPGAIAEMEASRAPILATYAVERASGPHDLRREFPAFQLRKSRQGKLLMYHDRDDSEVYTIGADVALGVDKKYRDWSVAQVYDGNGRNVATYRAKVTPTDFADVLSAIGHYYNDALIVCENNGYGHTTCVRLFDLQYPNLYRTIVQGTTKTVTTTKIGYHTLSKSKIAAIESLARAIRDRTIVINDAETLKELRSFISIADDNGKATKMKAESGLHDDCVMACALCIHLLDRSYPTYSTPEMYQVDCYW